ncbi:alpha/beta hydrolase [Sphingomonas abietis]|uniref:Alpha/beta hydrolase n=1 Tax=Sphingomonas abietis TaxID=3012344 RepID=A0ABY7NII6_9SPHN|nr:alpha/beta hydrolase [Sphingomonas abietis]WBO21342.1 alpha/beta hydrolase [Sphingomonas abietis]
MASTAASASPPPAGWASDPGVSAPLRHVRAIIADHLTHGPTDPTLAQRRAWRDALYDAIALPPDVVSTPVRDGAVRGLWQSSPGARHDHVLLYIHGGGYEIGSVRSWRVISAVLARRMGVRAFSVDYPLAPEAHFPAPVDNVVAAYRWLLAQGIGAHDIVFAGDSSGGGLTAAALLQLRMLGLPEPAGALLISPWLDLTNSGKSIDDPPGYDPFNPRAGLESFAHDYLAGHPATDPLASPLFGDLHGLPPLLIQVGGDEALLDDSVRFARRAGSEQVAVTMQVWPHMFHEFQAWAPDLPAASAAMDDAATFLDRALADAR